jgi:tetratricopeptide (TPR) repeat protein
LRKAAAAPEDRAYSLKEVERLLRMPRRAVMALIEAGYVMPARGARRAYQFTFRDLIALRTARALTEARLPMRRIKRALQDLRRRLPESVPLSGIAIRAVGERIVVQDGGGRWQVDSGQYLLDLDVKVKNGELALLERSVPRSESAEDWFQRGWELESEAAERAIGAYRRALEIDPAHAGAGINLGRLLHQIGALLSAERVYRQALRDHPDDALLLFNMAVLLEDLDRSAEAIDLYLRALQRDPRFADCHYNLSIVYQSAGNKLGAIRHLREYRKLLGR